ncbi:hypothetical protein BC826DRAFT_597825 [Russula brevipes]|nr:hypothetical protein BC826DRAFT_597825 [Russula brevipes]
MSCCGDTRPANTNGTVGTHQPYPVSNQPTPHPGISPFLEKGTFQPPNISPPPAAAQSFSHFSSAQSPPPTSPTLHGSNAPSPPPTISQMSAFNRGSVADPTGSLSPLRRPSPAYPATGNQNLLSAYQTSVSVPPSLPTTDEGKMSVSIDFGERRFLDYVPRRVQ